MNFPRLFKKTSTGAIQFWDIYGGPNVFGSAGLIKTVYGQTGTDSPQETSEVIEIGKNIGKKNETTPIEQAEAEAKSRWEKKKKSGYVENLTSAEKGELDDLIEGGIVPMLAHKFSEQGHKIKYPAYVQPKLDGIRCIAILKDGKCTLWSRTRKQINSCPHIVDEIESRFVADIVLDGELYNSQFKNNFEHIVHLVRQDKPDPQHTDVQYHIYDMVNGDCFRQRTKSIFKAFFIGNRKFQYLMFVDTHEIGEADVIEWFNAYKQVGYEGAMLRNADSLYVSKRSYDLQKVKNFDDMEFSIIGVEEGRGRLQGHVGAFICKTSDGKEFMAKMAGDTKNLKEYFDNHNLWKNKKLTVQYQGLTSYGIPRFPVGKAIRDYE